MRILLCLLGVLCCSIAALGQSVCSRVYSFDSVANWRKASNSLMRSYLFGDSAKGEKELYFYWHSANPMNLKQLGDGRWKSQFSQKGMRVYTNHENLNSENPLQYTNTFLARKSNSNVSILEAYLNAYKNHVTPEVIDSIRSLEDLMLSAAEERQSFGFVATGLPQRSGEILGTFRVYIGIPSHSQTLPWLPLEHSIRRNQIQSVTLEKLDRLRQENPNALIFELGRLSVHGKPEEMERTRALLDLFLLRYYIDPLPSTALFYAHAGSLAHARMNRQHYGFHIVETLEIPGKGTQYILEATGAQIREALEKRYALPRIGVSVLPP